MSRSKPRFTEDLQHQHFTVSQDGLRPSTAQSWLAQAVTQAIVNETEDSYNQRAQGHIDSRWQVESSYGELITEERPAGSLDEKRENQTEFQTSSAGLRAGERARLVQSEPRAQTRQPNQAGRRRARRIEA